MFDLPEISMVQEVPNAVVFTPDEKYNPEWNGYTYIIAKI